MPKDSACNTSLSPFQFRLHRYYGSSAMLEKVCGKIDLALETSGNSKKFVQIKDKRDIKTSADIELARAAENN